MLERVRFKNFKTLQDAEIKLGPFNLIVGPNGSGKSTVFQALRAAGGTEKISYERVHSIGGEGPEIEVDIRFARSYKPANRFVKVWTERDSSQQRFMKNDAVVGQGSPIMTKFLKDIRVHALEASKIAESVLLQPDMELQRDGANLAGALDAIRNKDEEAFNALRNEFCRWVPEYDGIGFETPRPGYRGFKLRRARDKQPVGAGEVSEGTLLALCLLTIAYNPSAPPLICLEEADRALHPRLLRELRDALYRLSFPTDFGLSRRPVQVIATTHSPLFLDLFKEHLEQIIIAEKHADGTASFRSLAEDAELREIIGDAPLGEVWYSGVLGGVPALR